MTEGTISIRNVCVIGAGTMGSGIAGHLANLGFKVTLLDVSQSTVMSSFDRAKHAKPPHFYLPLRSDEIRLGNTVDNLDWIREADWVCEAVVERLDVKTALYARIEPFLRDDAFVSTNTSGLEIGLLAKDRSAAFRRRFIGTHFFNPPRYLKLLELIPTPETDPIVVKQLTDFLEQMVARRVVLAKDTPGFIANRYGMWAMFHAIHTAEKLRLTAESVDAITGPFLGRPKSGSFRLNDIVGLDVMSDIALNLTARCTNDNYASVLQIPSSMQTLLERGWIGEKAKQGYYRREGKEFVTFDLNTKAYRDRLEPDLPVIAELGRKPLGERVKEALTRRDETGEFLREYLVPTLQYADYLKQEVSHSVEDFDRVLEWGFGWEMGPFAMMDAIGMSPTPYYHGSTYRDFSGTYTLRKSDPIFSTLDDYPMIATAETYRLHDLGDGVHAVALTTKMGVISPTVVDDLTELIESGRVSRFVLTSTAKAFSAGFDLKFFVACLDKQDFSAIDTALAKLHRLGELLGSMPSVAGVYGYCLGAGLELASSCSLIVAAAESQIGLPETKVGLIPGGRGTVLTRTNNQSNTKRLAELAITLTQGEVATNADIARAAGFLRPDDLTCYHPDRVLSVAKERALTAIPRGIPEWKQEVGPLVGMIDRALSEARSKDSISEYDETLGLVIKHIFSKANSYAEALAMEREEFLKLCHHAHSQARLRHMVETNKPLRN